MSMTRGLRCRPLFIGIRAHPGPGNELKDLADTIDGLLARLQAAFEAQRNFVASASHELRTPLTLERALLELAGSRPLLR